MTGAKPFAIEKREVWEAFKRVRANQGAAGVDGQTLAGFENRLVPELYKLWNRMSSGSCMPPPVRRVMIPKADGGQRPLGIPTGRTALRRTSSDGIWNPCWSPCSIRIPTDTGPSDPLLMLSRQRVSGAGAKAGCLIWTSKGFSTPSTMSCCSRRSAIIRIALGCCSISSGG